VIVASESISLSIHSGLWVKQEQVQKLDIQIAPLGKFGFHYASYTYTASEIFSNFNISSNTHGARYCLIINSLRQFKYILLSHISIFVHCYVHLTELLSLVVLLCIRFYTRYFLLLLLFPILSAFRANLPKYKTKWSNEQNAVTYLWRKCGRFAFTLSRRNTEPNAVYIDVTVSFVFLVTLVLAIDATTRQIVVVILSRERAPSVGVQ